VRARPERAEPRSADAVRGAELLLSDPELVAWLHPGVPDDEE
jgi:hypothetical protein